MSIGTLCLHAHTTPLPPLKFAWKVEFPLVPLSTPNTILEKKTPSHLSPLTHKKKRKRGRPLHSMTGLLIGCIEILFLKLAAIMFVLES
jgi:hypothetical protein